MADNNEERNAHEIRGVAADIIRRLRETDATLGSLMKEYHLGYYKIRDVIAEQVNEQECKTLMGGHRGSRAKRLWGWLECSQCPTMVYRPLSPQRCVVCSRDCEVKAKRRGRIVHCENCTKEIYRKPSDQRKSNIWFCSSSCSTKYQHRARGDMPQRLVICANPRCAKKFLRNESAIAVGQNSFFCCNECAGEYRRNRMLVRCSNCGARLERPPSEYLNYLNHFCDEKCKAEYVTKGGGKVPRSIILLTRELSIIQEKIGWYLCRGEPTRTDPFWKLVCQLNMRLSILMDRRAPLDQGLRDRVAGVLRLIKMVI